MKVEIKYVIEVSESEFEAINNQYYIGTDAESVKTFLKRFLRIQAIIALEEVIYNGKQAIDEFSQFGKSRVVEK